MATYTVQVKWWCPSGGHIKFDILRDGNPVKEVMLHRDSLMDKEIDIEDALPFLLRHIIKQSRATTLLQMKNAIESASLEF